MVGFCTITGMTPGAFEMASKCTKPIRPIPAEEKQVRNGKIQNVLHCYYRSRTNYAHPNIFLGGHLFDVHRKWRFPRKRGRSTDPGIDIAEKHRYEEEQGNRLHGEIIPQWKQKSREKMLTFLSTLARKMKSLLDVKLGVGRHQLRRTKRKPFGIRLFSNEKKEHKRKRSVPPYLFGYHF